MEEGRVGLEGGLVFSGKKAFSVVAVVCLLCGVFGGLVTEQSVAVDYSLWRYYKVLTVTNSSALPSGYQVNFTVWSGIGTDYADNFYLNNHGSELYADLRFVDGDGNLLDMWNQSSLSAGHVHVWVELVTSRTVVMYYGNSLASSVWGSESSVFDDVISGVVLACPLAGSSSSVVYDLSSYANNGVNYGASVVASPFYSGEYARCFDGSNDKLNFTNNAAYSIGTTTNFSMACWIKPNLTANFQIFDKYGDGGYNFRVTTDGRAQFSWRTASTNKANQSAASNFNDGVINHIVITVNQTGSNSTGLKWYRNGTVLADNSPGFDHTDLSGSVVPSVGYYAWGTGYTNGTLGHLILFNVTLASADIAFLGSLSYYPECSVHAGYVDVRHWVSGLVSVGSGSEVDTSEVDVAQSEWLGVGVSFGLVAVSLLLALKSKSWAVNFLFGLSLVGFLGWQFANTSVELFGGWLDFMVLVGAVLVLVKGAVLVRASGV